MDLLNPTTSSCIDSPVCMVGCGIAGLYGALLLADAGCKVLLITKSQGTESNSRYAQGGIAAVLPHNLDDSTERHVQDTLAAGAGLCDEAAVRSILAEGYEAVADLLRYGVPFDRQADGELAVTQEAAHSVRRIIHAGGDATGASVENRLAALVAAHPLITKLEEAYALDLCLAQGRVAGVQVYSRPNHTVYKVRTPFVVLATGGIGQLYRHSTNPAIATGDGLAMALRAVVPLQDMAFVQFHPTAFFHQGQVRFLVSEALRGEGGQLCNSAGERFAHRYHPAGELAPRDVVTRAIFDELAQSGEPCAYLDMTHLAPDYLMARFPTIYQSCLSFGVDLTTQPIPVAPAAHYCMGGIGVSVTGQTALPGLFAIGESARTGLHGANRLASNSLLECLVLARRTAQAIIDQGAMPPLTTLPEPTAPPAGLLAGRNQAIPSPTLAPLVAQLRDMMWIHAGIVRTSQGLATAQAQLAHWLDHAKDTGLVTQSIEGWEYGNQLLVAQAIVHAAMARSVSIGAHFMAEVSDQRPPSVPNPRITQPISQPKKVMSTW
jgi:L-aspartate oxidase